METGYLDVVLRSRPARALTILVIAACTAAAGAFVVAGDPAQALRAIPPLALVAVASWAAFWRPAVRVDPARVVLENPLRTIVITWPAISDVHLRWGLELQTANGRYSAWAAPRTGSVAAGREVRAAVRRRRAGAAEAPQRASDSSAAASEVVLHRWAEYRDAGLLGATEGDGVRIEPHRWTCGVLAVLLAATVVVAFLP